MSELISGKEAKLAWANGEVIQFCSIGGWEYLIGRNSLDIFDRIDVRFRKKPQAITINGIDVPKPRSIGWGDPNRNKVEIGFDSEDEAHKFYMKFKDFW